MSVLRAKTEAGIGPGAKHWFSLDSRSSESLDRGNRRPTPFVEITSLPDGLGNRVQAFTP
uniref:Uncharacterized protein n=1 Tax=Candidatus Kentrum sp. LFY TaxID=2126342 RepID=A0A450WNW6_9GAMM|nr:MAG: hypothetical protein BECKLFY1418C_GA0070996_10485 [Candidatus Kentron sp. LFY]